jgi:hypothetical protein
MTLKKPGLLSRLPMMAPGVIVPDDTAVTFNVVPEAEAVKTDVKARLPVTFETVTAGLRFGNDAAITRNSPYLSADYANCPALALERREAGRH